MSNNYLVPLQTKEWARFSGYLAAVQYMFVRGELDLTLESVLYESNNTVTDEDVIEATYSRTNEIEYRQEITLEQMRQRIDQTLSLPRAYWESKYHALAALMEKKISDGFMRHLEECIDIRTARIVELGYHVPYVNVDDGFTLILYSQEKARCMILVANWSD
jgi:hypothetical protein